MIKIAVRRNLIYPLQMLIWTTLRYIDIYLINMFLKFNNSSFFTLLMFTGEFLAGLIFYLIQKRFLSKNKKANELELLVIGFIKMKENNVKDNKAKTIFLILFIPFFDFVQFLLALEIYKFSNISNSLETRCGGSMTIYAALVYHFLLKEPLFKHQIFSLIIIGICLVIIVITEFIFQEIDIFLNYIQFFFALLIALLIQFFDSMIQINEKYLYENKNLSPFLVLMLEGVFGLILTLIYSFSYKTFDDIIQFYQNNSSSKINFLIIGCIFYIISSGGKNLFRVVTNKIFNPMTTSFMDYILNPFYIILFFITLNDFISNGKKNYAYFIINLIISFIMSFCGCVFNEFLILFYCGLEHDTHNQVTNRSFFESRMSNLLKNDEDDEIIIGSEKTKYIIQLRDLK